MSAYSPTWQSTRDTEHETMYLKSHESYDDVERKTVGTRKSQMMRSGQHPENKKFTSSWLKLCGYEDATEFDTNDIYWEGIHLVPVWSCNQK